jgi:tRNA A-37 threonylcarbamoyl transferase component Bud32
MTTGTGDGGLAKGRRFDRYEIRERIGQGGMGTVYRAIDSKLGRTVALKTVAPHAGPQLTEAVRQRFMREALAISKIDHRNVVQVLDFGFADDGTPFLVMEFLRGRDLGALVKSSADPLAIPQVADIVLGVCAGLRACHHADIVHRDLKPGNVFLVDTDTGWEVKVLDFGVSKTAMVADADITEEGQIVGTPQYLSPEQVSGRVGPESDQYALGVLLYVCLTKRLPFRDHQGVTLLRAIEAGRFEPPRTFRPDLPAGLEALILRAMATNPQERFESIHALGQKLWEFASPRGRDQWKNFYFHTPAVARSAKESAPAVPLLEVLALGAREARGGGRGPGAGTPRPAAPAPVLSLPLGRTAVEVPAKVEVPASKGAQEKIAAPGRADTPPKVDEPVDEPVDERPVPTPITARPQMAIPTKLAVPRTDTGALIAETYGRRRRGVALMLTACAAAVIPAALYMSRESRARVPAPEVSATAVPTSPLIALPAAPTSPAGEPPAPEASSLAMPTEDPTPPALPSIVPAARPTTPKATRRATVRAATKNHTTSGGKRPSIDKNGIGIPLD